MIVVENAPPPPPSGTYTENDCRRERPPSPPLYNTEILFSVLYGRRQTPKCSSTYFLIFPSFTGLFICYTYIYCLFLFYFFFPTACRSLDLQNPATVDYRHVLYQAGLYIPPVLSTCPLHTDSGCGKERRILIGPW